MDEDEVEIKQEVKDEVKQEVKEEFSDQSYYALLILGCIMFSNQTSNLWYFFRKFGALG